MILEKCATYCCIAWYISWMPYPSLSLGHAGRFWLVEPGHKSSPNPASELTLDSHSSWRFFHGKECCRRASTLIWNERKGKVELTGREIEKERGNKRNVINDSLFEIWHRCVFAKWYYIENKTLTVNPGGQTNPYKLQNWCTTTLFHWGKKHQNSYQKFLKQSIKQKHNLIVYRAKWSLTQSGLGSSCKWTWLVK